MRRPPRNQIAYLGMPLRRVVRKVQSAPKKRGSRIIPTPIYLLDCGHTVHKDPRGKKRMYCTRCPKIVPVRRIGGFDFKHGKWMGKYEQ